MFKADIDAAYRRIPLWPGLSRCASLFRTGRCTLHAVQVTKHTHRYSFYVRMKPMRRGI